MWGFLSELLPKHLPQNDRPQVVDGIVFVIFNASRGKTQELL